MNICIDVGNTTIVIGVYKEDELINRLSFTTDASKTEDEYLVSINTQIKDKNIDINCVDNIVYSSVVPGIDMALKGAVKRAFNKKEVISIGTGTKTGLSLKVDNPKEIGNDLIADLVGAKEKYGYPLLVVDLGTASKILLLDKSGAFSACSIMPGIKLAARALFSKAALLPDVSLEKCHTVLTKNTITSMNAGIVLGHAEMILGMCNRYEKELGYKMKKIITGGASVNILDELDDTYIYEENLSLDGLNIIGKKNAYEK